MFFCCSLTEKKEKKKTLRDEIENQRLNIEKLDILKKKLSSIEAENIQNKEILKNYQKLKTIEDTEDADARNEYDKIAGVYSNQLKYVNILKDNLRLEQEKLNSIGHEYTELKIKLDNEINETNALKDKINAIKSKLESLDINTDLLEDKLKTSHDKIETKNKYLENEKNKLSDTVEDYATLYNEIKSDVNNQVTDLNMDIHDDTDYNNIKNLINKLNETDEDYEKNLELLEELNNILK